MAVAGRHSLAEKQVAEIQQRIAQQDVSFEQPGLDIELPPAVQLLILSAGPFCQLSQTLGLFGKAPVLLACFQIGQQRH